MFFLFLHRNIREISALTYVKGLIRRIRMLLCFKQRQALPNLININFYSELIKQLHRTLVELFEGILR